MARWWDGGLGGHESSSWQGGVLVRCCDGGGVGGFMFLFGGVVLRCMGGMMVLALVGGRGVHSCISVVLCSPCECRYSFIMVVIHVSAGSHSSWQCMMSVGAGVGWRWGNPSPSKHTPPPRHVHQC